MSALQYISQFRSSSNSSICCFCLDENMWDGVIGKSHPVSQLLNTWNSFVVLFLFLSWACYHTLEFRKNACKFRPDQTCQANLPFFACYELMLFRCLCFRMSFGGPKWRDCIKVWLPNQPWIINSFVTLLSSFQLFRNIKLVLLPCLLLALV